MNNVFVDRVFEEQTVMSSGVPASKHQRCLETVLEGLWSLVCADIRCHLFDAVVCLYL